MEEYLAGREIHGFTTRADLDINALLENATKRWLRPNEVHAVLSNYGLFRLQPQPVDVPPNGSLLLFDRKILRNFRKDGYNWKKKKDGKTIQEAHEKLKIGNEERIHVYYARNEDDPNFYRRCYWLLDRELERIVLVHYRQTREENSNQISPAALDPKEAFQSTSPVRSVNSTNTSNHSEISTLRAEEVNSAADQTGYAADLMLGVSINQTVIRKHDELDGFNLDESNYRGDNSTIEENLGFNLDELDGLSWKDLMEESSCIGIATSLGQDLQPDGSENHEILPHGNNHHQITTNQKNDQYLTIGNAISQVENDQMGSLGGNQTINVFVDNVLHTQNNFEKWDYIPDESHNLLNDQHHYLHSTKSEMQSELPVTMHSPYQEQIFSIVDISPAHAYHNEETKIIVVGYFHDSHKHLEASPLFCVFGDTCVQTDFLQAGVYRVIVSPHVPGSVNLYLTLDGHSPISQVINFQYRSVETMPRNGVSSTEVANAVPKQKDFEILIRLAHLLCTTTNSLSVLGKKISPKSMADAKIFEHCAISFLEKQWKRLLNDGKEYERLFTASSCDFFELLLKYKLQEWLLFRTVEGCKAPRHDRQGQGVIHLCSMLDYSWAIKLFSMTRLSLDFRDVHGWTPLHWAAYYGREKTVASLLSAGANPSLVSDPSPNFPGGCTPADLASQEGFEGLGAYLAEKGLSAHLKAMSLSGSIASLPPQGPIDTSSSTNMDTTNLSEQELCLKDSLAAYRNAADAADRIQTAFRQRSFKEQERVAQLANSEIEASSIIAALKIQKAFRNHSSRKMLKAAVAIQGTFRTWQARRSFLNMRRQAIKIQSIFRAHQERRKYKQLVWSVGVFEKAVLRWRLKRTGLRGLKIESVDNDQDMEEEICVEEEFYRVGREQAEDRIKRSVVRVQAMFRSYRAQQEYRRIKLACNLAKMEFNEPSDSF